MVKSNYMMQYLTKIAGHIESAALPRQPLAYLLPYSICLSFSLSCSLSIEQFTDSSAEVDIRQVEKRKTPKENNTRKNKRRQADKVARKTKKEREKKNSNITNTRWKKQQKHRTI